MSAPLPTQSKRPYSNPQPALPPDFDPEVMPIIALHWFGWWPLGGAFGHVPAKIGRRLFEATAP